MRQTMRHFLAAFFSFAVCVPAMAELPVPPLRGRVNDLAGVLSTSQKNDLGSLLARYENETGHQIVVLTVPALKGETIESFALRTAQRWAVGHKGLDNGIVLVLAPSERKVRIELGKGFAPYVPNQAMAKIIQTRMIPALRKKDYAVALIDGVNAVMLEGQKYLIPLSKRPLRQTGKSDMSFGAGATRLSTQR